VKNIIRELYVDKEQYVIYLLEKYGLDQPLQNLVNIINVRIHKKDLKNLGIKGIPSSFLTTINSRYLDKIKDTKEKEELEYLITEISIHLLNKYIQSIKAPQSEIIKDLHVELRTACELNDFDYKALNKIFPIETLVKFAKVSSNSSGKSNLLTKPTIFYYYWNGRYDYDLDDLVKNLKAEKHISDIRGFKKIFKEHSGNLAISISRSSLDFIIILFDILSDKSKQLIIPKGKNCGKFHPLKVYAVDFENKVLIKNEAKHIKYRIMKNKPYYLKLKGKAEKWTKNYEIKS